LTFLPLCEYENSKTAVKNTILAQNQKVQAQSRT